jgi:general secretion pathway protein M
MRSQLAQVEQMADEARRLGAVPAGSDSPQAVKAQLEKSIEGAGLKPALAQLTLTGNLFELRFKSVPYAAWLAWLDAAARETRLRVVDAAVTRETGIGVVSVRLALEMPRREAR